MNKTALITGATSGIGRAVAKKLAQNGYNIIITGRRSNLLEALKNEISKEIPGIEVLTLNFDVRKQKEVSEAINGLPEKWSKIDVLVNNAGLAAGLDPIQEGSIDDWEQMIDTNVKGLLYITRCVTPSMVKNKSGHIINLGSIAGKEVYENGNVYCATKHAVDALTKGMRIDLLPYNIKVTSIDPGMVETEFSMVRFKGDKKRSDKVYEGLIPLCADDIADAILFVVTRPPHVNINDMIIMPTAQANSVKTFRK
ncbi:MAG: SDR family oxidoreductase [Bacteroidota bacterium]|nr:SDR family oxidoreductase [Bacteroidota bacterium]MDP4225667.1 SDR family oxidoreductase [Bacteroidota bacterium]